MWPAKTHLGPQLTYGVSGSPVVRPGARSSDDSPNSAFSYPRLQAHGPMFYEIHNSAVELAPGADKEDVKLRREPSAATANFHDDLAVSAPVLAALDHEAAPLHEPNAYDPSRGPFYGTFQLGTAAYSEPIVISGKPYYPKAKSSMVPVACHAFAADPYSLRVVPMMPRRRNYFDTKTPKNSQKTLFSVPQVFKYSVECRFPFEIYQVETHSKHKIVVVRGLRDIAFLTVSWKNNPSQKGIRLKKAFAIKHESGNVMHMTLSENKFAFVDSNGIYSAYTYALRETWEYELISSAKLPDFDPSDTSMWRRLCWPAGSDNLFYFARKSAARVCTKSGQTEKLITFHAWSRAQDLALIENELFLLTSQEIIWVTIQNGNLERRLSWKHYLDNMDVTLKLAACFCESEAAYNCLVYSSASPARLMFTFGFQDGFPCSLRDPYMVPSKHKFPMEIGISEAPPVMSDTGPLLSVVEMNQQFLSVHTSFCGLENRAFQSKSTQENPNTKPVRYITSLLSSAESRMLYRLFSGQIRMVGNRFVLEDPKSVEINEESAAAQNMARNADENVENAENDAESGSDNATNVKPSQCELVQDYAFQLGAEIKPFFEGDEDQSAEDAIALSAHRSLATIAENVPMEVTDLEEFDSMLSQLREFYESQDISLLPFDSGLLEKVMRGTAKSIKEIPGSFEDYAPANRQQAAILLATSMTKAHANYTPDYLDCIEAETEEYPEALVSFLNEWEIDVPEATQNGKSHVFAKPNMASANGKHTLLRRALTQNSQLAESQNLGTSKHDLRDNYEAENRKIDSLAPPARDSGTLNGVSGTIPSSPPLVHIDSDLFMGAPAESRELLSESPKKGKKKKADRSKSSQIQNSQELSQRSQSQGHSQAHSGSQSSQRPSQSSQSIKRPGLQPVVGRKKKKAKGGFA
ncbi:hypothetical protein OXX80_002265 [Metschnikowia pulcherrima]